MAFTLEAAIVIPVTMFLTIGIISSSIDLYGRIETESRIESESMWYVMQNDDIWSCRMNDEEKSGCSKMISVNPVKAKSFFEFVIDSAVGIREFIPVFKEMEALFFEDKK